MTLQHWALTSVAISLALLLMIVMAPMTGANVGAIGILLDLWLGESWEILPIFTLIPFAIIWVTFSIIIALGMCLLLYGAGHYYQPRDEHGRQGGKVT